MNIAILVNRVRHRLLHYSNPTTDRDMHIDKFFKNGAKPWTEGYHEYKFKAIGEVIYNGDFNSLIGSERYGYRIDERIVEIPWLFSRLNDNPLTMLDAGSALNFEPLIMHPKLASKKLFISTLSPEGQSFMQLGISYVFEDLRETCFRENFFDVIACISTIEHVGLDNTFLYTADTTKKEQDTNGYLLLLDVLRSRLKHGGRLFLTFPFGKYKNHDWFQVFDGNRVDKMVKRFSPASYTEAIFMYHGNRWTRANRDETANAVVYDINVNKNYAPDFCAFSQSVACIEMVK